MKIPAFKEINPPDKLGYWTNLKTGEKYGGQYISPLLIPNFKNKDFIVDLSGALENQNGKKDINKIDNLLNTIHNENQ